MHIKFFMMDQEGNEEDLFLSYPSKITTYDMMRANQYSEDILNGISSNIKLCKREFGKVIFTKDICRQLKDLQKKNRRIHSRKSGGSARCVRSSSSSGRSDRRTDLSCGVRFLLGFAGSVPESFQASFCC